MTPPNETLDRDEPSPYRLQVILKYALFQVPETLLLAVVLALLDAWLGFDAWVWWLVIGGWIVKEIAFYPFVWRSFDDSSQTYQYDPIGKLALAVSDINPQGKVRLGSELWSARVVGRQEVTPGQTVRVVSREGLTLVVTAEDKPTHMVDGKPQH